VPGLDFNDRQSWTRPLPEPPDLVLVHISDIHFKASAGGVQDRNKDLRNQLLNDLRRQRTHLRKYDAIVVTGDIAFAGKRDEFNIASKWLDVLREHLDMSEENILVIPGNHDVDRDAIVASTEISELHARIRACSDNELQATFGDVMSKEEGHQLFHAIAEFNVFARQYGCVVHRDQPFWERDFSLSDGLILRIRGMTSTCISGPSDDDRADKLMLGEIQCTLQQEPGVEYLTMAHHPPSWLLDQDTVQRYLNARARIQLYGHKHEQWIEPAGNGIRVVAGAVHPERSESNWIPRYNVITLSMQMKGNVHSMEVVVYPRRWSHEETCFIPDCDSNSLPFRYKSFAIPYSAPSSVSSATEREVRAAGAKRRLQYRLEMLAKNLQIRLAQKLGLLGQNGLQPEASEFVAILIKLAGEQQRLGGLFDLVEEYRGEGNQQENPFRELFKEDIKDA